jgi:hypothetical protein
MALDTHVGCKKEMANNSFEDLCSSAEPHWMTKKREKLQNLTDSLRNYF